MLWLKLLNHFAVTKSKFPYFSVFGLDTEIYSVNLRIQSEYRKMRTRKNAVFGPFLCGVKDNIFVNLSASSTLNPYIYI